MPLTVAVAQGHEARHGARDVVLEADLLLGPREVTALVAETEPHIDDLPFVEYTAGQTLDRTKTPS